MTDKINKGRWSGNTKVSKSQIQEIIHAYQIENLSQYQIASYYNLSQTGVSCIIRKEVLDSPYRGDSIWISLTGTRVNSYSRTRTRSVSVVS